MAESVIVVGGGIVGTSTSYYLARLGVRVTLIEARDIAAGTSGACDRAIMLQSKAPGPMLQLGLHGARIYETLEDELETDLEYRRRGGMILIETEEEMRAIRELVERQRQAGLDIALISGEQARELQPGLAAHLLGATWWAGDAEVNPLKVCFAMAQAAQRAGAAIRMGSQVTALLSERGRVIGVEAGGEKTYADAVVVALGVWTPLLLRTIGIELPIVPRKGQILVSERVPAFVSHNILSGAYIAAKHRQGGGKEAAQNPAGVGLSLGQTASGSLLIGGSREFVGFDLATTPQVVRAIGRSAVRLFPKMAGMRVIRAFAGLRPYTPDGRPVIGPVEGWPGLYVAAGHEGDGIALGPATGRIMANLASGRPAGWDVAPFALSRFTQ